MVLRRFREGDWRPGTSGEARDPEALGVGRVVVDGVRGFAMDRRVRRVVLVVEVLSERCFAFDDAADARGFATPT